MPPNNYVIRVLQTWAEIDASEWNALAQNSSHEPLGPFMRHEYLAAMHESGSAVPQTGWSLRLLTLWQGEHLAAACPVYLKAHSYGEYVFDWAWANAYQQHGLSYYPKALVASPFTPVPGPRLLAVSQEARLALVQALLGWCQQEGLSSLHLLFLSPQDLAACQAAGLMLRQTVQFHWHNQGPNSDPGKRLGNFDEFLASLSQDKRKKIRQERRKVAEAGVVFRWARGRQISPADWDFFYRCYERTYLEHGNAPYLSRDFFARLADQLPEQWLLFVAEKQGRPIASSLIGLSQTPSIDQSPALAYGRYWGALERVDCLHFEACYYQPLAWCITHGVLRFEGGAQGEHKMARALMPTPTHSAHWLAHPAFADAVERFLEREKQGVEGYLAHLQDHSPFRQT